MEREDRRGQTEGGGRSPNGQLWRKTTYKDGEWHGAFESYYENGQLHLKTTYKDGQVVSREKFD